MEEIENVPYKLPDGWKWVKLEKIIFNTLGGGWGQKTKESEDFRSCYVIRGTDFSNVMNRDFSSVPIRYIKLTKLEKIKLENNDLIIEISGGSKDQPTGRIALIEGIDSLPRPVAFSNFTRKLEFDKVNIYSKYIFYFWIREYNSGKTAHFEKHSTNIRNLKYKDFISKEIIPIPFKNGKPDLEKQREIVKRIEEIFQKIEKAEELRKRSLEKTKLIFDSALNKIFENAKGNGWREVEFKNIGNIVRGVNFRKSESISIEKEGFVPIITASNIVGDILAKEKLIYVPSKKSKIEQKVKKGDIIIVMSTGSKKALGRVYFSKNNEDVFIGAFLGIVRLHSSYYQKFFYYFMLTHNFRKHLLAYTGSQINNIGVGKFKTLKVPIPFKNGKPDLEKQKEIAEYLDNLNNKVKQLEELQKVEIDKLKKLKDSILNKAFRGELV